jgi:hypothetical protein
LVTVVAEIAPFVLKPKPQLPAVLVVVAVVLREEGQVAVILAIAGNAILAIVATSGIVRIAIAMLLIALFVRKKTL